MAEAYSDQSTMQLFRQAREEKGLSLTEVALATRIQQSYIVALENHRPQDLPSLGYVLGYIRTYANYLGLSGENCVQQYKREIEAPKNIGMREQALLVANRKLRLPRGLVSAMAVIVASVTVALWYGSHTPGATAEDVEILSAAGQSVEADAEPEVLPSNMITLKAIGPTWVRAKASDGKVLFSRVLVTGESWRTPRDTVMTFSVRDAGALEVYLGADRVGTLGAKGQALNNIRLSAATEPRVSVANIDTLDAPR